jgi:muramidase (phage lysozyme)
MDRAEEECAARPCRNQPYQRFGLGALASHWVEQPRRRAVAMKNLNGGAGVGAGRGAMNYLSWWWQRSELGLRVVEMRRMAINSRV